MLYLVIGGFSIRKNYEFFGRQIMIESIYDSIIIMFVSLLLIFVLVSLISRWLMYGINLNYMNYCIVKFEDQTFAVRRGFIQKEYYKPSSEWSSWAWVKKDDSSFSDCKTSSFCEVRNNFDNIIKVMYNSDKETRIN